MTKEQFNQLGKTLWVIADLFAPQELGWKDRSKAELALMDELVPFLKKQAQGRDISGLAAYE